MYEPKPVDTGDVDLGKDLIKLTEVLAENSHDNWAKGRIAEGWVYGPERDDEKKLHPDLVPYSDLSDSEKQYDRNSAMETLKVLIKKGYAILTPDHR